MPVAFDEGVSNALIDAASHAASELRGEGILRRGAAEPRLMTSKGVYGRLFTQACGLPDNLQTASDLNAEHVHSGHARSAIPGAEDGQGDQWAWTGRDLSRDHHVNPISPDFGSHAYDTDTGGDTGLPVTDHGTSVVETGAGYLDPNTESL